MSKVKIVDKEFITKFIETQMFVTMVEQKEDSNALI